MKYRGETLTSKLSMKTLIKCNPSAKILNRFCLSIEPKKAYLLSREIVPLSELTNTGGSGAAHLLRLFVFLLQVILGSEPI